MNIKHEYRPLNSREETLEGSINEPHSQDGLTFAHTRPRRWYLVVLLATATFLASTIALTWNNSLLRNEVKSLEHSLTFVQTELKMAKAHLHVESSAHADLVPEVRKTIYEDTPYKDMNDLARADKFWDAINIDAGNIALSDDYAQEYGLPRSQRFPWDDTKGLYLLNGYHHLHCLKQLYTSFREYRDGLPQSRDTWHTTHCLDALRREVICAADDTPRASTREFAPNTGVNQWRTCRDWNKLEAWALKHTSCFSYRPLNGTQTNLDRFKYCPKGSPYFEAVKKVFPDATEL